MQSDFDPIVKVAEEYGVAHLGLMTNEPWQLDPRRLVFTLSRYKFVAATGRPSQRLCYIDPTAGQVTAEYVIWLD